MGSYGWGRSPEEVQRSNGVRTDFDMAVKRYESTKPLQGKRKTLDVRPTGQRERTHERIVKVSDTEYYLTCMQYGYRDEQLLAGNTKVDEERKAITLKQEGMVETIIIHKPSYGFASNSIFYFYDYNLPKGMDMTSYHSIKYVRVANEGNGYDYYNASKGDITFYRAKGTTKWTPLTVYPEVKHSLDRTKTKEIRKHLETFLEYAKTMLPFVESKHQWGEILTKDWREQVVPKVAGEYPEEWMTMLARYASRLNRYTYNNETKRGEYAISHKGVIEAIKRDAYKQEKPLIATAVPLGEMSNDPYRGWL
jgi:hypothetical protein